MRIFRSRPARYLITGFFDQVEVRAEGDVLVIEVTERPAVSRIDIEGNQAIKTEDLLDSLRRAGIVEGDVLKRATLDQLNRRFKDNTPVEDAMMRQ